MISFLTNKFTEKSFTFCPKVDLNYQSFTYVYLVVIIYFYFFLKCGGVGRGPPPPARECCVFKNDTAQRPRRH
jgi:hypothetical protein